MEKVSISDRPDFPSYVGVLNLVTNDNKPVFWSQSAVILKRPVFVTYVALFTSKPLLYLGIG